MCSFKLFIIVFVATAVGIPIAIFSVGKLGWRRNYLYTPRASNDTSYLTKYYQINYRSVEELYEYMHLLVNNYTFFCKIHQIGHTGHKGELAGYPIYMISLGSLTSKPNVLVIAGVYASDWASVTSILFLINQLLINCAESGALVATYNWKFIPILNPDGYNYSKSIPVGENWIKNRARWSMDATGVNLNYNFGRTWKLRYNFHQDTYPGIHAFSEKESKILKNFVEGMEETTKMVVILRSATKRFQLDRSYITYPWSHTTQQVNNWYILQYLASLASKATNELLDSSYQVMQSGYHEENQSGTIGDWLYGDIGIKTVFTIKRNFKASTVYGPYDYITKAGQEVFSIIKNLASNLLLHPNVPKVYQDRKLTGDRNERTPISRSPSKKL